MDFKDIDFDALRAKIHNMSIDFEETGRNNFMPVLEYKNHGISARISFAHDQKWGAVVNNRGQLFSEWERERAISYAKRSIRDTLLDEVNRAQKTLVNLADLLPTTALEEQNSDTLKL